ncbi:MAG: glycosyltransferase family 9 protein [Blastochloris sp.]|nr:glycosyltransferase family 9 protein [Blastochloris sp.]
MLDLRGGTELDALLALMAASRLVLSTDSGPLHLAALSGAPVLALFGASSEKKTAPRARHLEILTSSLPCRPCLKRHCAWSEPMACLTRISVDQVVSAWQKLAKVPK